jgi:hypothetical protein
LRIIEEICLEELLKEKKSLKLLGFAIEKTPS